MTAMSHNALLKDALQGTGFVRRGSAFFRVWGDGVLQVLKFERERVLSVRDLRVGIFSMYGSLSPEWFTSGGCIPRGSAANFVGLRFVEGYLPPASFAKDDTGQHFYEGFPVSLDSQRRMWADNTEYWEYRFTEEQQLNILRQKVLPWLDEMTSQSLAAKAMYKICPVPNDSLRFDAHLAAGELTEAEEAMSAILKQHADARASWERTFSKEKFEEMAARQEARDIPLKAAYEMAQKRDEEAISVYLSDNYKRNCLLAKFCMK